MNWRVAGLIACALFLTSKLVGQDQIPETTGFGGHFVTMPGIYFVKSNVVVSGAPLLGDVGNYSIPSLEEVAETQTVAALPIAGEINYTFGRSKTQLYFGNRLIDIIRLDGVLAIGIRQEIGEAGILAASFLVTPFKLDFWSDPFVENIERIPTAVNLPGVRIRWGNILQTGLELTFSARKFKYDHEKSGQWLVEQGRLNKEDLLRLSRNGETFRILGTYKINLGQHYLQPGFRYNWNNHDGSGIANKRVTLLVGHGYKSPKLVLNTKLYFVRRKTNDIHPVFNRKITSNGFGCAVGALFPIKFFSSSNWSITLGGELVKEDFNTNFYSSTIGALTGGLLWRFSTRN